VFIVASSVQDKLPAKQCGRASIGKKTIKLPEEYRIKLTKNQSNVHDKSPLL
jgi:hypothetical protein